MPTARSPSTVRIASVTIPAGLVKLMTQASGATSAIVRAMSRATGIVRRAKARPPGPMVSWPSSPSPRATRSSTVRASAPPTRTAENTKSAPVTASRRSVVALRRGSATARPEAVSSAPCASITAEMVRRRAGSTSCRAISSTVRPVAAVATASWTSGTRNPPPPRMVSFMASSP